MAEVAASSSPALLVQHTRSSTPSTVRPYAPRDGSTPREASPATNSPYSAKPLPAVLANALRFQDASNGTAREIAEGDAVAVVRVGDRFATSHHLFDACQRFATSTDAEFVGNGYAMSPSRHRVRYQWACAGLGIPKRGAATRGICTWGVTSTAKLGDGRKNALHEDYDFEVQSVITTHSSNCPRYSSFPHGNSQPADEAVPTEVDLAIGVTFSAVNEFLLQANRIANNRSPPSSFVLFAGGREAEEATSVKVTCPGIQGCSCSIRAQNFGADPDPWRVVEVSWIHTRGCRYITTTAKPGPGELLAAPRVTKRAASTSGASSPRSPKRFRSLEPSGLTFVETIAPPAGMMQLEPEPAAEESFVRSTATSHDDPPKVVVEELEPAVEMVRAASQTSSEGSRPARTMFAV